MSEQKTKNPNAVKNFFKSKIFKWILILILEYVSIMILVKIMPTGGGSFFTKPFFIYFGICILLSIGALSKISKFHKKTQTESHEGVVFVMSKKQYQEEQLNKATDHMAVMIVASLLVAPFAAPVSVGTILHNILCKILK